MLSLSLDDDAATPPSRTVDEIGRRIIHAAAASRTVSEFLEQAATTLLDRMPLQGVVIWQESRREAPPELMAAVGDTRGLDHSVIRPRRAALLPATVSVETFELLNGSRIHVAVSRTRAELSDQYPTGWLREALWPGVQLRAALTRANESTSMSDVLIGSSTCALVGLDLQGRCMLWNNAAEELFGWPEADVLDLPLRIIPRESQHSWRACMARVLESGLSEDLQIPAQRWDGSEVLVEVRVLPLQRDDTALPNVLLWIRDQTPLDDAREWRLISTTVAQAAHSGPGGRGPVRECLRALASPARFDRATIWLFDSGTREWSIRPTAASDGENAKPSPATQAVLGQLVTEKFLDLAGPMSDPPRLNSASAPGAAVIAVPIPGREAALVLESANRRSVTSVARDTLRGIAAVIGAALEREQLEEDVSQLRQRVVQAEKLEALGLLTTSVAHDLNNILTIIFGYADLAKEATSPAGHLNEIEKAADAAAHLTRQLLNSGRSSRNATAAFDVAAALEELRPLLRTLVGPRIALLFDNAGNAALSVRMPRTDFDQIVLNLVANARDAMPDGGTIRFQLSSCEPTLRDLKGNPQLRSARCVQLRVVDAGCGMAADVCERVFQPFFTTKAAGQGTGVGLATVRQIVDRAAGGIMVESSPGAGTAFTVMLPQTVADLCPRSIDGPPPLDPRGNESILVAHEDRRVLHLVVQILELKGYRVRALSLNQQAALSSPQSLEACDLLVTDVSSLELLFDPAQRPVPPRPPGLLVISNPDTNLSDIHVGFAPARLLTKPFTSQQLAIAVREALDARPTAARPDQRPRMLSKRLATESEHVRQTPPTA
jgi:PAS domain S-box-containing protein